MINDNQFETLNGVFTYCIYKAFNYAVYRFHDEIEGNIIVTGNLDDIDMDSKYTLYGRYVEHVKYGFQFEVFKATVKLPSTYDGIIAYLSSNLFKGIGKKKAEKIVNHLGLDTLNIIKENSDCLKEIGIKDKDIETIMHVLSSNLEYEDSFYYLISLGFSTKDINKIIALYKENTKETIMNNPYCLYFDIYGIGFKKCEELAHKLNFDLSSDYRMLAYISYIISELCFRSGNTYLSYYELKEVFIKNLNILDVDFDDVLRLAIKEKIIVEVEDRYYPYIQYIAETEIARYLLNNNHNLEYDDEILAKELEEIQNIYHIKYDDKQKEALYNFYKNKISLIIGGPGTGKTTIVKALVKSVRDLYPTYDLHVVAPTGRAAKRISELCDVKSSTIHSLLRWDKESNSFTYGIDNPLLIDVLIIDEFSMVDNWLFYKLICALYNVKKICIIGDDNQLPSVGPGNVLRDIINSDLFKTTRLETIFRQENQSSIIKISNDILNNAIDFNQYHDDIKIIQSDDYTLQKELVKMMNYYLDMGYSMDDIEVLSPMYKGNLGIDFLNNMLQNIFNPKSKDKNEIKYGYKTYREGDKIIQLKNQNSDDVYNGDIGFIMEINIKDGVIIARFDDIIVEYTKEELSNIALAYVISVHKAQGSEYPIVFLAISKTHSIMLNKNLIYTAVSRASNNLIILGDKDIFIKNSKKHMLLRKTSLNIYLKDGIFIDE